MITTAWAILWRNKAQADKIPVFVGRHFFGALECPEYLAGYAQLAFGTRAQARAFIAEKFSYIRSRPDLQRLPHGWKMPVAVKVNVSLRMIG
jgi:hypothetical protein